MGLAIGQRVADYEVVSVLGSGGMGCVYRVCNVISQRTEAMKILFDDLSAEPELAARFRGEIRTLAALDHPNIAQLHTALQNGNELVMIMEFVEGCTLHQLAQPAPLSPEQVAGYIQQVLAALGYAHSRGVVHRDIKPANIMVTPKGEVKLTDFGIAKSKAKHDLTRPGTTLGSLNYMSPEQALGIAADERSDIYSVGITMYELLAGTLPFDDEAAYVVLHRQLNEIPRSPIEMNPSLSQGLSDLIMKALEKDASLRFQTAAEFSEALREVTGIAAAQPVESPAVLSHAVAPAPAMNRRVPRTAAIAAAWRPSTRRRGWSMGAAAIAAMVLAGFTALAMPRLLKSGAMAKTLARSVGRSISISAPQPSPDAASAVVITANAATAQSVAQPPAAPTPVDDSHPVRAITVVSMSPQPEMILKPSLSRARVAGAKLVGAAYHLGAPPRRISSGEDDLGVPNTASDMPKAEAESTPALPAAAVAEVKEIRRQKDALDARASIIRASMVRLRAQKMLDGHELNQSMADAYVNMNVSLAAESADLESGDVAAARSHMEKATNEVSLLEKLFSE